MAYDLRPREYRMKRSRMFLYLVPIVAITLGIPCAMVADGGPSASVTISFSVVCVTFTGWLCYAAPRCGTRVDVEGIHVRGMVTLKRLVWEDVQDIRAEGNPAAEMRNDGPAVLVFVYGRDGRRMILPSVDDQHVDVERELAVLTAAWQELRGGGWSPDSEAAVLISQRRTRRQALWAGFASVPLAFFLVLVLELLQFSVDMPGWLKAMLNPFVILGVVPVVFTLTVIASYRKQSHND
ncbi:PH domain-containing protein [Streptomyces geranii]|uniref:PH domain-containing protein n=1 Tax=Streptomyces geranii TaxID=2058923 RepID=UPI000D02BBE7|nr:PH domain-containing protein [Streptomyces geranii]